MFACRIMLKRNREPLYQKNYKQKINTTMANVNATKRVKNWIALIAIVVFNVLISGCSDPYEHDEMTTTSEERISKPQPQDIVPGLDFRFNYINRNHGWFLNTEWDIFESVTGFRDNGLSYNAVSHKDDRYAVEDKYREVSLQYTQERTFKGTMSTKTKSLSATRRVYADSVRWTANIEDGNLVYCDAIDERIEAEVRDTMRTLPYIRTVNAKVKAINTLPGTTKYMTRAAYVSDSICREIVWDVEKEIVGISGDNFHQELRDTFKVLLLSEDEIDHAYAKNKQRVVLDDVTERCSFTEVFVMKSGEEHENPRNYVLNRLVKGIDEYLKDVTSFNYTWRHDNALNIGNVSKGIRKENNWTVDSRTDNFGALISNDAEPITTVYTYYHEGCTYEDQWLKEEYPIVTPAMKENETHVEPINSDTNGYVQARLFNTISTEYLGWNQNVGETVKLQMPETITIVNEGWEDWKCTETIYNDSIVWEPWYMIEYSNGSKVETKFHFMDVRDLIRLTDWMSIEENESETTGDVAVNLTSSKEVSAENKDAKAVWTREVRELSNNVRLAGSNQTNKWRSTEANGMTVTFRGQSFTFSRHNVSTSHADNVTGGSVVGEYKVYNYTDDLAYTFGDNTKHAVDPGTIKVPAVTIISEGWDNASAKEIWSDNRVDWSLDWVVKFSNGNEDRTNFAWHDDRVYTVDTNWSSIENNANYNTGNYVVNITNNAAQSKDVNGAVFSWTRETRSVKTDVQLNASNQTNGWTAVDPFNCSVTYKGKTFDFGRKSVSLNHKDNLSSGVENGNYMVYTYGDAMSYTIAGNTKTLTAPGEIKVLNEIIVSEGWDNSSAKQTVTNFMVNWSVDYVVKYNTGKEDRTNYSHSDMRSLTVDTDWTSIEKNNNQSTTSATATVSNTAAQSQNVNGATFKWNRETRSIKSTAKLNASNQQNGWTAVDPNSCTVTYNGRTYTFDKLTASVSNTASVNGGNEQGGYKVYTYGDKLTYTYGGDSKTATAPGTIKVKVKEPTFFPESWGAILEAKQTVANNESHKSFVYTWSLRFENGYVLPVVIRSGSDVPEWNFEFVEKTQVTSYNGGTYESSTGKWINTTAQDQPDHMIWARSGVERANKNYNEAKKQNWDEGRLINGKPSVTTSRYSLTINNGFLSATDTYTGHVMGTWSSYVGD